MYSYKLNVKIESYYVRIVYIYIFREYICMCVFEIQIFLYKSILLFDSISINISFDYCINIHVKYCEIKKSKKHEN